MHDKRSPEPVRKPLDFSKPIVEAEASVRKPRRFGSFVIVGGFVAILLGTTVVVVALALNKRPRVTLDPHHVEARDSLASDSKFTMIHDAFSNPSIQVSPKDARLIESTIQQAVSAKTVKARRAFIDRSGFLVQMERSGKFSPTYTDKTSIRRSFSQVTDGLHRVENNKIISIRTLNENEAIAYVLFWDDPIYAMEFRLWMVRNGDSWKISDWERIDEGLSVATEYAILCAHQNDPGIQNYYEVFEQISTVSEYIDDGDLESAKELLARLEKRPIHSALADSTNRAIGDYWTHADDIERALACYKNVKLPEDNPGVLLGLAYCYEAREEHKEAAKFYLKHLDRIGTNPVSLARLAECYETLDEFDKALDCWQQLIAIFPIWPDSIVNAAALVKPGQDVRMREILACSPNLAADSLRIANSTHDRKKSSLLSAVLDLLKSQNVAKTTTAVVEARIARLNFEYDTAAQLMFEAVQAESDEEKKKTQIDHYLWLMVEMGMPTQAYQNVPDKEYAFSQIVNHFRNYNWSLTDSSGFELAEAHDAEFPNSSSTDLLRALLYSRKGQKQEEEELLASLIARVEKEDPLALEIQQNLIRIMGDSRPFEAYRLALDKDDAYRQIGQILLDKRETEMARQLVSLHSVEDKDDLIASLCETQTLLSAGKTDEALARVKDVEPDGDNWWLDRTRRNLLYELLWSCGKWKTTLRDAEDPTALFDGMQRYLLQRLQFDDLKSLITFSEELKIDPISRLTSKVNLARETYQDKEFIELLRDFDWENVADQQKYLVNSWKRELFQHYLRSQSFEPASKLCTHFDEDERHEAEFLLDLHRGVASNCRSKLDYLVSREKSYTIDAIFRSEMIDPYFTNPSFLELRQLFPPPIHLGQNDFYKAYFAFPEKTDVDMDRLRENLDLVYQHVEVQESENGIVVIRADDLKAMITFANGFVKQNIRNEETREALKNQTSTTVISVIQPLDDRQAERFALLLGKSICSPNCLGVYLPNPDLFYVNPSQFAAMNIRQPSAIFEFAKKEYLYLQQEGESDSTVPWKKISGVLKQLSDLDLSDSKKKHFARINQLPTTNNESPWVQVVSVQSPPFDEDRLIVELDKFYPTIPYSYKAARFVAPVNAAIGWKTTE